MKKIPKRKQTCRHCRELFMPAHTTVVYCSSMCSFMAKVDKGPGHGPHGDCWLWKAFSAPYGRFTVDGNNVAAHVYSARHLGGMEVVSGLFVCHTCDVPRCVNPKHLFLATPQGNMDDKVTKSRQARGESLSLAVRRAGVTGEAHPMSKLTLADVMECRAKRAAGESYSQIARHYGVTHSTVSRAINGVTWRQQ